MELFKGRRDIMRCRLAPARIDSKALSADDKRIGKKCGPGILLLFLPTRVLAEPIDPAGFLGEFFNQASRLTDQLIGASTQLARFSELEWTTFTVFALVIVLIKWTVAAAAAKDVIFVVLMILIAQALMQSYEYVLAVFWRIAVVLSDDISLNTYQALNLGASGIDSTGVFLLDMINHIMERITFEPVSGEVGFFSRFANIGLNVRQLVFMGIFLIVLFIVYAVSWIVSVIGLWSLLIGKVLGPIFIPFLIFKGANRYFDGWLNFMLGAVAYFIVAQINIAFTTLIIMGLFDSVVVAGQILTLTPEDFIRLLGYSGLLLIAAFAMFKTDRMVSDMMQGGVSAAGAIGNVASGIALRMTR